MHVVLRPWLFLLCLASVDLLGACGPEAVHVSDVGLKKLPLAGRMSVIGVLRAAVRVGEQEFPAGTRLRVEETWLLRKDPAAVPAGYRVMGLHDPTAASDGLALPRHAVEVYFHGAVLPASSMRVAVPSRLLEFGPQ
jgi:hypothetical protein